MLRWAYLKLDSSGSFARGNHQLWDHIHLRETLLVTDLSSSQNVRLKASTTQIARKVFAVAQKSFSACLEGEHFRDWPGFSSINNPNLDQSAIVHMRILLNLVKKFSGTRLKPDGPWKRIIGRSRIKGKPKYLALDDRKSWLRLDFRWQYIKTDYDLGSGRQSAQQERCEHILKGTNWTGIHTNLRSIYMEPRQSLQRSVCKKREHCALALPLHSPCEWKVLESNSGSH